MPFNANLWQFLLNIAKKEQNAKRIIIRARKDSKAPLQIMPPLQVHDDNGEYTAKAQEILRKGLAI